MIRFTCPNCEKSIKAPEKHGGRKFKCAGCANVSRIPESPPLTKNPKMTNGTLKTKAIEEDVPKKKRFDKDKVLEKSKSAAIFSWRKLQEFYVFAKPHVILISKYVWNKSVDLTNWLIDKFRDYQETKHQNAVDLEEIRLRQSKGEEITAEESLRLRKSLPSSTTQRSRPETRLLTQPAGGKPSSVSPANPVVAAFGAISLLLMFGTFFLCCGGGILSMMFGGAGNAPHPYGFTDAEAMEHGEKITSGELSFWDDPRETPTRGSDAWYEDDDVKYSDKVNEFIQGKSWDDFK